MKAIEINGNIKTFGTLPKSWDSNGTTILNFNKLSDAEAQAYGFYDVVTPTYDSRIEELKNLYLEGDVYTYDVVDKKIDQTLAELKSQKIRELKSKIEERLSATDWYLFRKIDTNKDIPTNVINDRNNLRQVNEDIEAEINALFTKKDVILFEINL